jgi:putative ABC transport system permease protein
MIMTLSSHVASSPDETSHKVRAAESSVHYDFFATLGIKVLAGRVFDREYANDAVTSSAPNIVIDQSLAEQNGWLRPEQALGKTLYLFDRNKTIQTPHPRTVVGVVENRPMGVMNPEGAAANMYQLAPPIATHPIVRIAPGHSAAALQEIESVWNKVAPSVALKMQFADEAVNRIYQQFDTNSRVFSGIAALALFISLLGLIGMSIHVIGRRQHEIGLRKTLGASVYSVVRLLLLDCLADGVCRDAGLLKYLLPAHRSHTDSIRPGVVHNGWFCMDCRCHASNTHGTHESGDGAAL